VATTTGLSYPLCLPIGGLPTFGGTMEKLWEDMDDLYLNWPDNLLNLSRIDYAMCLPYLHLEKAPGRHGWPAPKLNRQPAKMSWIDYAMFTNCTVCLKKWSKTLGGVMKTLGGRHGWPTPELNSIQLIKCRCRPLPRVFLYLDFLSGYILETAGGVQKAFLQMTWAARYHNNLVSNLVFHSFCGLTG
jgi:hypothetical protein